VGEQEVMGNRFLDARYEKSHARMCEIWNNRPKKGKYFKRQLHKAERRITRGTGGDEHSLIHKISTVNWKGW
jgi:hypothetical protein